MGEAPPSAFDMEAERDEKGKWLEGRLGGKLRDDRTEG
jgi:hypothetical protein